MLLQDDVFLEVSPLPNDCVLAYSYLYHWTSIRVASSILKSKQIYGKDLGGHANFSVSGRSDIASGKEVLLAFKFQGQHQCIYGDTFGSSEAPIGANNTAFHLFSSGNADSWGTEESREQLGYWQSNIYPGTAGLSFKKIIVFCDEYEELFRAKLKKPGFFSSKKTRDLNERQQKLLDLKVLARACRNAPISVPLTLR